MTRTFPCSSSRCTHFSSLGTSPSPRKWIASRLKQTTLSVLDKSGKLNDALRSSLEEVWNSTASTTEAVARSIALVDDNVATSLASSGGTQAFPPSLDPFFRSNVALWLADQRVSENRLDDAAELLAQADSAQVVDRGRLHFLQVMAFYPLGKQDEAKKAIDNLRQLDPLPRRYLTLAESIQKRIEQTDPQSLEAIASDMRDVRRRLDLGEVGTKVRSMEDDVVRRLDLLIKKVEEKQETPSRPLSRRSPTPPPMKADSPAPREKDSSTPNVSVTSGLGVISPPKNEKKRCKRSAAISGALPLGGRRILSQARSIASGRCSMNFLASFMLGAVLLGDLSATVTAHLADGTRREASLIAVDEREITLQVEGKNQVVPRKNLLLIESSQPVVDQPTATTILLRGQGIVRVDQITSDDRTFRIELPNARTFEFPINQLVGIVWEESDRADLAARYRRLANPRRETESSPFGETSGDVGRNRRADQE